MPRVTDHTRTEKIGGDSFSFCGLPSRAGNRYDNVQYLFNIIASLVNVVGVSAKPHDILRDKQAMLIIEALRNSKISSGQSLNQETSLRRFGDTRWVHIMVL